MGTIDLIPSVNFSNPLDIEKANGGFIPTLWCCGDKSPIV